MKTGIHDGIPFADYLAVPACSNSRLSHIHERSAAYCKYRLDGGGSQTDAMVLGVAAHAAVLEPGALERRCVVAGQCEAVAKSSGERCKAQGSLFRDGGWYCRVRGHAPPPPPDEPAETRAVLTREQFDSVLAIRESVWSHPRAAVLLDSCLRFEASAFWTDTLTGLPCKARPDALGPAGLCIDLKVSAGARPSKFPRYCLDYGMHRQAAFYMDGLRELGKPVEEYRIVAVESTPPYEVVVYRLHPDALEIGRNEIAVLKATYAECARTGIWPGFSATDEDLMLPAWAMSEGLPELKLTVKGEGIEF